LVSKKAPKKVSRKKPKKTVRKTVPKKTKPLSKAAKVTAFLKKRGIDQTIIGPAILLAVDIIVRVTSTAHEIDPGTPEISTIDEIRNELRAKGILAEIEKAGMKERFDQALNEIVNSSWSHYM
jgi:hypothetical protein